MFMTPKHFIAALVSLASFTVASMPAHAVSGSASAAITNFDYRLIDLDLTDNITPSITWSFYPYSGSRVDSYPNYDAIQSYEFGTIELIRPEGSVSATRSEDMVATQAQLTAGLDGWSLTFNGSAAQGMSFTLSPSTGLLISATGSLSLDKEVNNHGEAGIGMTGGFDRWDNPDNTQTFEQKYVAYQNGERDYLLSAYLSTGKEAREGSIVLSAESYLYAYPNPVPIPSPIPEPATYGMLLAGALVVGAASRRRRGA